MVAQPLSDEILQQAIDAVEASGGSVGKAAKLLGIPWGTMKWRYQQAKERQCVPKPTRSTDHPARVNLEIENGVVLVAGDAHYWPEIVTTVHKALVRACKEMQPRAIIMNGDIFDGASVSRHQPIGWEKRPSVVLELEACRERLAEIEQAAGKIDKIWPLGNHDARFETRLATVAPEYAKVHGVHLKDHFAFWESCWSCWINDGHVVVKHRLAGGVHATRTNVLRAGTNIITNHLHQGKATPVANYVGNFWGVDTGTLCEPPWYQALDYLEDAPVDWRSSFSVLTFVNGEMLEPEFMRLWKPGQVSFRGRVHDV